MTHFIDDSTLEGIELLSKLTLTGEERVQAKKDMNRMLDYIDKLKELDTEGVEPLVHAVLEENYRTGNEQNGEAFQNVFREDIVSEENFRDNLMQNAPESHEGMLMVPRTVG